MHRAARCGAPWRARPADHSAQAARRAGAADRRRGRGARMAGGRALRAAAPGLALPRATREDFDAVVRMLAEGFTTRRGRAAPTCIATRSTACCAAGAARGSPRSPPAARFPTTPTTTWCSSPPGSLIGTLNEDFAVESLAGDVFQLGNASYRILRVERGTRARRRRPRPAAHHSVLAGRGAGPHRRTFAFGIAAAPRLRARSGSAMAGRRSRLADWRRIGS